MKNEQVTVTLQVTRALDALDVPYFVGGSMVSSTYGEPRNTVDTDIIADLKMDQVDRLAGLLQADFT